MAAKYELKNKEVTKKTLNELINTPYNTAYTQWRVKC